MLFIRDIGFIIFDSPCKNSATYLNFKVGNDIHNKLRRRDNCCLRVYDYPGLIYFTPFSVLHLKKSKLYLTLLAISLRGHEITQLVPASNLETSTSGQTQTPNATSGFRRLEVCKSMKRKPGRPL